MSDEQMVAPHNTALARQTPSRPARVVMRQLAPLLRFRSILDYGCGRGADVDYYRANGYLVEGYDPYVPFGWNQQPSGVYDLVTVIFVLNVLPTPLERLDVLQEAKEFLAPGGAILVVARSEQEIRQNAVSRGWAPYADGYWSNPSRGMFQHGMTPQEITALAKVVSLQPHPLNSSLRLAPDAFMLLQKSP